MNNKAKKLFSTALAAIMVFGAMTMLFSLQPVYGAGSMTSGTTFFASGVATIDFITTTDSGLTSGGTVYFYLSSEPYTSGYTYIEGTTIGSTTVGASSTDLANTVTVTIPSTDAVGSYYLILSSSSTVSSGMTLYTSTGISVVSISPEVSFSKTLQVPGGNIYISTVSGHPFDPSSSLAAYLNYPGGPSLTSSITVNSIGYINSGSYFTVPTDEPQGGFSVVIQEIVGSPNGGSTGITADSSFSLEPTISVSTQDISGSTGSAFAINGEGFPAGATIASYATTSNAVTVGGVDAQQSGVSISDSGGFSLDVTGIVSAITTSGPKTITITTSSGTFSFASAIYVSIPGTTTGLILTDLATGTSSGAVGDPLGIVGYGFPVSGTVTVNFDGVIFHGTADSNGFFDLSGVDIKVPTLQALAYSVFAIQGGVTVSTTFSIVSSVLIQDSNHNPLSGEYAAAGSSVTVVITGYAPYQQFDITDSGLTTSYGSGALALLDYRGKVSVTISTGTFESSVPAFIADGSGALTLTYSTEYGTVSTGISETVTVVTLQPSTAISTVTYKTVGMATTALSSSYAPSTSTSLTFSGLVPLGADATPESVPYLGPFYLSVGIIDTSFYSSASGTASVVFTSPSGTGVYSLTVKGNSGVGEVVYENSEFIVSTASTDTGTVLVNPALSHMLGGSGTSGSPWTLYSDTNGVIYFLKFDLYNFPASTSISVTYYTASGPHTLSVATDTHGAATYLFRPPYSPGASSYEIIFSSTGVAITNPSYFYSLTPAVSYDQTPYENNINSVGEPATDYQDYFGTNVNPGGSFTIFANSLAPNTAYNVYVSTSTGFTSSDLLTDFTTNSSGGFSGKISLPSALTYREYYLDFSPSSDPSSPASLFLTVEVGTAAQYAFPGEVVNSGPIPVSNPDGTVYYMVTVTLNGSAYKTMDEVPFELASSYYLNFSFAMPNGAPGSWYYVGYEYAPVIDGTMVTSDISSSTGTPDPASYTLNLNGQFTESGTATFDLNASVVSVTNVSNLAIPLSVSGPASVSVDGLTITSYSYTPAAPSSGNFISLSEKGSLTVYYSVTFTVTGAISNPVTVTVNTPTVNVTGLAVQSPDTLVYTAYDPTNNAEQRSPTPITNGYVTESINLGSDSVSVQTSSSAPSGMDAGFYFYSGTLSSLTTGDGISIVGSTSTGVVVNLMFNPDVWPWSGSEVGLIPSGYDSGTAAYATGYENPGTLMGTFTATINGGSLFYVDPGQISSSMNDALNNYITANGGNSLMSIAQMESVLGPNVPISLWVVVTGPSAAAQIVWPSYDLSSTGTPATSYTSSSSGFTETFGGPFSETGTATFSSILTPPTSIQSLAVPLTAPTTEEPSPIETGLTITHWSYNGISQQLEIDYTLTFLAPGLTSVVVGTPKVSCSYNFSESTQYVGASAEGEGFIVTLVQGDGAYVMGINSSQIATIEASLGSSLTASLSVPISELNSAIVSINNGADEAIGSINNAVTVLQSALGTLNTAVAVINTQFGLMTVSLNAINATVQNITNGEATVLTDLGSVKTSLTTLNSSLVAVDGSDVTIATDLGTVQASLNTINTTVSSSAKSISGLAGSEATVQTSLGDINGTVTNVSNGTAYIETDLGIINASVGKIALSTGHINTNTSATGVVTVYEYIILVLIGITLIIAVISIYNSSRVGRRLEEQMKK